MLTHTERLDAHAKPPNTIRELYKRLQRLDREALLESDLIDDYDSLRDTDQISASCCAVTSLSRACLQESFQTFLGLEAILDVSSREFKTVEHRSIPVQISLLERLFHRDLSDCEHKTNVHMHYDVSRSIEIENGRALSFFHPSAADHAFRPKNSAIHKPISTQQFLSKKLRWMTLGGQYDWTNKVYPDEPPPAFPQDIKQLIENIFPMKAEAAIVNLYSPGDTLSLHRDVSEDCDQSLVSLSMGCDGIFVIGLDGDGDREASAAAIRLKSGDAVLMSGKSRFAWHGVPKIVEGTCPNYLSSWPSDGEDSGEYSSRWKFWMRGKRINLNVRQMFASE